MLRLLIHLAFGALACFAFAGGATAEEGGDRPFTWRPSFQIRGVLTDNIGLTDSDTDSDFGYFAAPRVEAAYRESAYELEFDGSVDVRRYTDDTKIDETFYRVFTAGEVGILPGLTARLSNAYTPHVEQLGRPDDDPANMIQSNRAEIEMRYWRELAGARELAVGLVGGRFDTEKFTALVPGSGGTPVLDDGFRADFWESAGYVEFQNPFGEQHAGYARALVRQRSFDEESDADHVEASGVVGFRTHLEQGLEFDVAGGWGWVDFHDGGDESQVLARADLKLRRADGWRFNLGFHHELTVDITGEDFTDTTGRLGVEKYFGKRTAASVTGFISRLDSDATDPSENLFGGVEVNLRRQLSRRVMVSLSYRYWDNAGDFDSDDFDQSRVVLGLTYRH
jgi:hypothetical protein